MSADDPGSGAAEVMLRIERLAYTGEGLALGAAGHAVPVPFTLPGELVAISAAGRGAQPVAGHVLEPSADRVTPACAHFGACGGCQYQMAAYPAQLAAKAAILRDLFEPAGLAALPELQIWGSPEAYGYRNRIRLRVGLAEEGFRLGYNVRGSREFLPIRMCPIAAPGLWRAAEALLRIAAQNADAARWLANAGEVEIFCTADESRVQMTLFCTGKPARDAAASFSRFGEALGRELPTGSGAGAVRVDRQSGRALETVAEWGAPGLPYAVGEETYWVSRGGFFQVNRFLLPKLVDLVCGTRTGELAWDLFAGVGLFSRVLARRFRAVTAVEANPIACKDLRGGLARLGSPHRAAEATAVDFLRKAVLERERPQLIVLDPPRAGAGQEVCALLGRVAPAQVVYLSCDATTLARDLGFLTQSGYRVSALHLIDLFPQTYHVETLAILDRVG